MKRAGYQGSTLIGFIVIAAVTIRTLIHFQGQAALVFLISLLALYTLLYGLEPWLSSRFQRVPLFYIPAQAVTVIVITNLRPYTDITCLLYIPLGIQVVRVFSQRTAAIWTTALVVLLSVTLIIGLGWLGGLALILLYLAVGAFLISYDFLVSQTQADEAESQRLLTDMQSAHAKLQEYAAQAEELAAARERNRLARELHDSVSQAIFSITLTSQSARLLLEREPARVPAQLDRLQTMTEQALAQLRSLIAQLRPPQNS
jgi:signal transduction histidine kinase